MTDADPIDLDKFNGHDIYPMPMFITIAVPDVAVLSDWYVRALGFAVIFSTPPMVHLRRSKYQDVLVVRGSGGAPGDGKLTISFHTDDLDALASRARTTATLGMSAIDGPVETPWNTRDLHVTDPAGNHLVFTTRNLNVTPEQEERMRKMLEAGRQR